MSELLKFNPFHKPGGDEHGGEFAATDMDGGAKGALARASDRDK